ncbi:phage integrase SAM-like domain-containing protein, partial [Pseudomonas aeruginosa]|nr:phage integrase SAM-like domain-containing protein [Pseudomonas aeruginosa]
VASIITYAKRVSRSFLCYCSFMSMAMKGEIGLRHIDRGFVASFIRYLEASGAGYTTQKNIYTCCKSVLGELVRCGLLSSDIFPPNPYPHSNRR